MRSSPRRAATVGLVIAAWLGGGCEPDRPEVAPAPTSPAPPPSASVVRVVSLTPPATRFLLAIGVADHLVGVDAGSAQMFDVGSTEVVDLASAGRGAPDLVIVGEGRAKGDRAQQLRQQGIDLVEFAPHDLEDAIEATRALGERLLGRAAAIRFERSFTRPLAEVAGSSFGRVRPRVVGLVGSDPVRLAGGHSYETDLIEIAGGTSATHGEESGRRALDPSIWTAPSTDLAVHFDAHRVPPAERERIQSVVPDGIPILFHRVDAEGFWLGDAAAEVRRLQRAIRAALPTSADRPAAALHRSGTTDDGI